MRPPTILCVDDERNVLLTLRTQLQRHFPNCTIEIAESGAEALEVVEDLLAGGSSVPLVIADQIMPAMQGDQFLIELHRRHPQILKMMLTGQARAEDVGNVVNQGSLYRFLSKPWDEIDLQLTVSEAIRRYQQEHQIAQQQIALAQANQTLEALNTSLEQQVQERTQLLQQEINNRQLVEDALRASEERYRLLSEISPVGIFRNDLQGRCTYANIKTLKITGLTLAENLGEDWGRYLHPEDRDGMYAVWSEFVTQTNLGQPTEYQVEQRYLHRDGTLKWALAQVVPERNAAGELVGFVGSIVDITERKQAEIALQAALEFNQQVIATAQEGIIVWDHELRYCVWNRFMEDLSGISAEQVLGQYCLNLFPFLQENGIFALLERALAGETVYAPDAFFAMPDTDRSGWTAERFTPLQDAQGNITGVLGTVHNITQRKQTEAALSQSQARLTNAQRIAHLGNWEFDLITQKISWSEELFHIFGRDPAQGEPTYEALAQQVHPADQPVLQAAIERAIADGTAYEVECRIFHPDGSIRYLVGRGEVIFNAQNQVIKLVGTGLDQTRTKQIEMALREGEEQFRQLTNYIREVFYIYNLNPYQVVYISPGFEDIWGITGDELRQNPALWVSTIHPEDQNRIIQAAERQRHGHSFREEYRIIRPDGQIRWIYAQSSPIADPTGCFYRIVGICEDITARKQAEQALQASERKYHQILDAILDIVVVKDSNSRLVWGNKAFRDYYGMTLEELEGIIDAPFNQPDHTAQYLKDDALVFTTGQRLDISEEPITRYDGIVRTFNTIKAPIFDENGQVIMLVAACRDITEQKQFEAEFRESQQQLSAIASNVPGGVFRFVYHADGSHSCPFASEGYRILLGIDPEELKANPSMNLAMVHPEDLPIYEESARAAVCGQENSFQGEVRYILPTGEMKWISTIAQLNRQDNGDVIVDGIDIDISYRKQLEADLIKREAFLDSIYNGVAVAITVVNVEPDGIFRYIDFNPVCKRLSSLDFSLLQGKTLDELTPWIAISELEALRAQFQYCVETGESIYLETALTINGQQEWWLSQHAPLKDETGHVYRLVGTSIPITERKRAEAQLEAQNRLLARIARGEPLAEILQAVILQIEQQLPGAIGSILLLDETNRLRPGAAPNLPPTFTQAIDGLQIGEQVGSCGTAAYLKQMVVVPDITIDSRWESFKDFTLAHGLRACWSTPIIAVDGRVLGTFAVYYTQVRSPEDHELAVIHQIANIAGIAIERDLAETKLRRSQEQLELTLDFTEIGAWNWHPVTGEYAWNGKMAELLELPLGLDNMFQIWCDRMHPDDVGHVQAKLQEALATQSPFTAEYRYRLQDGRLVWRWVKGQGIYTQTGELERVLGVVQDITDRKQSEFALQRSEEQLRLALEFGNVAVWDWNAVENRLDWTDLVYEMLGYRPGTIESSFTAWFQALSPDDCDSITQEWNASMAEGRDFLVEYRVIKPDGHQSWISDCGRGIYDATGKLVRAVGIMQDITERKRTEQALHQLNEELELRVQQRTQDLLSSQLQLQTQEQFLRGIFEGTENPIFVVDVLTDSVFRYTGWNYASELISGIRSTDVFGKSPQALFGEELGRAVADNYRRCYETGEVVRYEEQLTFGGRNAWTLTTLNPLKDAEGRIYRIVGNALDITDRKRAEEALQAERLRLQLALDAAQMGTWSCNPDTGILTWSDRAQEIFGFVPGTFPGHREAFLDQLHPEDMDFVLQAIAQTFETGAPYNIEYRICRLDREVRWVAVWGTLGAVSTAEQQLIGVIADITDRKQAESQLREQEQFLRSIYEGANQPIFVSDVLPDNTIQAVGWNSAAARIGGKSSEEIAGKPVEDLFPPQEAAEILSHYAQCVATRQPITVEECLTFPDHVRWMLSTYNPLINAEGQVYRIVGTVYEITERKQFEEALRQKEEQYRTIFEAVSDGIFINDLETGRLVEVNPATSRMHGYSRAEMLNLPPSAYIHPNYLEKFSEYLQALRNGELFFQQAVDIRKDGSMFDIEVVGSPFLFNGKPHALGLVRDISQRKQSELALQEAQRFAQSIADNIPNIIHIYDLNQNKNIYTNREVSAILGYSSEAVQAMGHAFLETVVYPDDFTRITQLWQQIRNLADGEILETEYRMQTAHGTWRWLYDRISVFKRDDSGRVSQYIGAVQDITDRKMAEAALAEKNAILQSVIESTPDIIFVKDAAGRIIIANSGFAHFSHQSLDRLLGQTDTDLWPVDTATRVQRDDRRIMQTGTPQTVEESMSRPDGSQQTYLTTKSPWYDAQGNIIGIIGLARDITEQKQSEIALHEAQQFAQSIADQTPAALYIYDLASQCNRYSNRSITDLLGYSREEILAMGDNLMPTLLHPDDVEKVANHQQALLAADDSADLEVEYRMRHANGEWRWFYSRDSVFKRDAEGRVIQYIGAAQDMTERKRLEQDLLQINAELEQRVTDRTQDLQHAMEAAQAANHAKTTFLANMSHELRTPLNAILGFSQLLNRDGNLTTTQQEQISIINRSGEHLLSLINDILAMSKIEAGRITLTVSRFDLRELLNDLEALFRLKAEAKRLALTLQISTRVPRFIQTDEGKLRQVLINLLSNAIKFTSQGSVTLRIWPEEYPVQTTARDALEPYSFNLHFEVADTGCGIDMAEQAMVFEPFGQTQSGRNSQEGTGLGLPISRQFIQLMGGELQFSSTPNQGTTFRFTILVEGVDIEDDRAEPLPPKVVGLAADQTNYRLLIVEDNAENRQFLVQLLNSVGFEVQTAVNGQEAVDCWQNWQPNLIWMDMRMPILDGYAATKQIRRLEQQQLPSGQQATKILALTASAFEDERAAILAAGCDDFLFKPITETVLFEKMAQHLGVRYIYQDQTVLHSVADASVDGLTRQELQSMPSEWVAQLQFAARTADEDLILEIINQLPSTEANLATALRELVDTLQIEKLIELTQVEHSPEQE